MSKWIDIKNLANNKEAEILIYGEIGDWWDELDAGTLANKIKSIESDTINVRMLTYGGSLITGLAVYNVLKQSGKTINIYNDGIIASAGTIIACAGNLIMPSNSMFMIHSALMNTYGNAQELREQADLLDKFNESIKAVYRAKTGLDDEKLNELMSKDTWLNAQETFDLGFASQVIDNIEIAAKASGGGVIMNSVSLNNIAIRNLPKQLLNNVKSNDKPIQEGGKPMDLTQFKADHSAIADQFKAELQAENKTAQLEAVKAERQRVLDIQNTAFDGQEQLVQDAINNGTEAGAFAIAAAKAYKQAQTDKASTVLNNLNTDAAQVAQVANAVPKTDAETIAAQEKAKEDNFFNDFGDLTKGIK